MKRLFNLLTFFILNLMSYAYDFEVDGIYYNVLNLADRTVEVTHSDVEAGSIDIETGSTRRYSLPAYDSNYSGQVVIPSEVEYKGKVLRVVQIGQYAFTGQKKMTSITLPNSLVNIVEHNFGETYLDAFWGCSNLKELKLGNNVLLNKSSFYKNYTYGNGMHTCSNIESVTLLEGFVGEINTRFYGLKNLKRIVSLSATPPVFVQTVWYNNNFSDEQFLNLPVYVPEEFFESYQNADTWKDFWELRAMKKVTSIDLNASYLEMGPNDEKQLFATILPDDAFDKRIVWSSSDNSVATVNEDGLVVAVGKGDAVITAKSADESNVFSSCNVHVDCLVTSIELNTKKIILEPSQSYQLSLSLLPVEAYEKNVAWTSLSEDIASVDGQGNVTANSVGKTQIVVTTIDGSELTDVCDVMVVNLSTIERNGLYFKLETDGAVVVPNPDGTKYQGSVVVPSSIEILDLGVFPVETIASNAFSDATQLKKIMLPVTIKEIDDDAFAGCSALEFVGVENESKLIGNFDRIFADSKIKELYLGSDNIIFDSNSKLLGNLKSIVIGNSVTRLPNVCVCSNSLERFVVEDGVTPIKETSDYCSKDYQQVYCYTIASEDVYYRYGYLVYIKHLNPLADLVKNETLKFVYFGREVEGVVVEQPTYEVKATSAGSRYQEWGYFDEYYYQYQELIANTIYHEVDLNSISLNTSKAILNIGESIQLSVVNNPISVPGTTVIQWCSSDENVALVDIFGNVTLVGEGEAIITAQTLDGTNCSASCLIIDSVSGIEQVHMKRDSVFNAFKLNGEKVRGVDNFQDINNLQKGVYIFSGKKVVVR